LERGVVENHFALGFDVVLGAEVAFSDSERFAGEDALVFGFLAGTHRGFLFLDVVRQ
jgi:hypothetical protein